MAEQSGNVTATNKHRIVNRQNLGKLFVFYILFIILAIQPLI